MRYPVVQFAGGDEIAVKAWQVNKGRSLECTPSNAIFAFRAMPNCRCKHHEEREEHGSD
jgi:hypothetical protein